MTVPADAVPPTPGAPATAPPRKRSSWSQLYFLLAAFNVLSVCLALYLSHRLMVIYTESIAVNAQWVARGNEYAKLGSLAAAANAPGNDIFDSRDVDLESRRLASATRAFDAHLATLRSDLRLHVPEPMQAPLGKRVDAVASAMEAMTREATIIFEAVARDDFVAAGERMASMDRTYHQVSAGIDLLRQEKNAVQKALFAKQLSAAKRLNVLEALLAGMILLMIAGAVIYGRRMGRQAEQHSRERERQIMELEKTQLALAAAHDELEHRVQQRTVELDSFFDLSLDLLCIASVDGHFRRLNPAWETVLGYPREELMSRPFMDFVHPDDVASTVAGMEGLLSGSGLIAFENRYRCRDGSYKWLLWQAAPDLGQSLIYAAATDITERRTAQEALQAQATGLAEAQQIARLGNWEWEVATDTVLWSQQMYRVFGIDPEDFIPSLAGYLELIHPDDRAMVGAEVEKLIAQSVAMDFEHRSLLRDGSVRYVHARGRVVLDADGAVAKLVGTAQDITERSLAEQALRDSEDRFQLVSRATNDVIWDWDLATGQVSYNRAYSEGFAPQTQATVPHTALPMENVHPDDLSRIEASVDAWLSGRADAWTGEYRMRLSGGSYAHVLDRALVQRDASGVATRVVGTMMDVSVQKRQEHELREAMDVAHRANRAKSDFLANMSHEIRTPMNGVLGTLGLLLDGPLSPTQRELAGLARASGETLLSLINDILDFSKIEAGKLSLEPIPFDLLRASEGVVDMMAALAAGKNLDLVLRYAPEVPRHVIGDPGRIRQVLTNLLSNAIKFTDKGQVLVDVEADAVDEEAVSLRIRVEDTGLGISASQLEHVFDKFTQADASTTRRHGGTGLGLAISSQLVELMGGSIGVDSVPGEGSTFWFTIRLPLQKNAPLPLLPPADLAGVRVLIVDDNEVNRRVLHEQVLGWKMRNGSCASADEALLALRAAHAAGDPYGIAILDYQMPVTDGAMLGRAIKDDPELRDVSLIMLTSMGQRGDVARLKTIGFAAYLVKPARQSELLDALATVWSARLHQHDPGMVTRHTLLEERAIRGDETPNRSFDARVLLAEDHPTNQIVASMMLRNLGCTVDLAGNGREAVEMLALAEYDLVFMDCEMPVMDGFEATAEIRLRADATARIPIIAVTAQAMQGDRERCLRAGMNDYISKPVQTADFAAALQRWAPTRATPVPVAVATGEDSAGPLAAALDVDVIARLRALALATDPSLLAQIFASFQRDGAARIVALQDACHRGDAMDLHKAAHALRGASGNIGALALAEFAGRLEAAGETGDLAHVAAQIEQLQAEFVRVASEIGAIEAEVAGQGERPA